MINFKTKLPKWEIHDENGNLVNARELPDKSITTETMADEFISTPHHVDSYMKALNNQMLLMLFMKHMRNLASFCVEKSESDKQWDSTYNTGIVHILDNLLVRYAELFKTYNVASTYDSQNEIRELYNDSIKDAHIVINGREITNPAAIGFCVKKPDIRANSAGFKALIPHYTEEQFIETMRQYLDNCSHSSEQTNFWFIISELIRRIESGEV